MTIIIEKKIFVTKRSKSNWYPHSMMIVPRQSFMLSPTMWRSVAFKWTRCLFYDQLSSSFFSVGWLWNFIVKSRKGFKQILNHRNVFKKYLSTKQLQAFCISITSRQRRQIYLISCLFKSDNNLTRGHTNWQKISCFEMIAPGVLFCIFQYIRTLKIMISIDCKLPVLFFNYLSKFALLLQLFNCYGFKTCTGWKINEY